MAINVFKMLTEENQKKVTALNRIAQSSHIQIVDRNFGLLNEGYLKAVEPKNKTQAYFVNEGQTIVELSAKGRELLLKVLA